MDLDKIGVEGNFGHGRIGNTRPSITNQDRLRVLVDYVSITFNLPATFQDVFDLLGLGKLEFEVHEWGKDTFTSHARFSNIVIQHKDEFTYQLHLSGQGCREYEDYSTLDWFQCFAILKDLCQGKATRIDIAIDDFTPYYTVNMVRRTFLDGRCRTRMKEAEQRRKYNISDVTLTMDSMYFGSINSRLAVNFYDKKLEREGKNFEVTEEFWTRTELRCKREYADDVIDLLLIKEDFGAIVKGILSRHINFVKKSKQKNISRVEVIKWWQDFLNGVEPIQLSVQAPDKTIERTKKWIDHSVGPSLALIKKADPRMYDEFINEVLIDGEARLNKKHEHMINQYNDEKYKQAKKKIYEINKSNNSPHVNEITLERLKNDENKPRR